LLWEVPSKQSRRLSTGAAASPLIVYGVAMLVADWLPWLSLVIYFSVPALYFGLVVLLHTDPRTKVAAEDLS
jgi:hypothetical protein